MPARLQGVYRSWLPSVSYLIVLGANFVGMSAVVLRARQMSLALLVMAVVDHGSLTIECSGSRPNTSGLMRLGRDLMRRSVLNSSEPNAPWIAPEARWKRRS
jgi:hypothetical protein